MNIEALYLISNFEMDYFGRTPLKSLKYYIMKT